MYSASVVVHRLEHFFKVVKNIFVFKTHLWRLNFFISLALLLAVEVWAPDYNQFARGGLGAG
jgi:hypothetical protein